MTLIRTLATGLAALAVGLPGPAGAQDRNADLERYSDFGPDSPIHDFGRPVGLLEIEHEDGFGASCTAFILSELYILTNAHCVPGDFNGTGRVGEFRPSARAAEVTLTMGFTSPDRAGSETFDVDIVPAESSRIYDFAVLRVRGNPASRWGAVTLSLAEMLEGQPGLVLHHPDGEPMRVTRRNCFLLDSLPTTDTPELLIDRVTRTGNLTSNIRLETSCAVTDGSSGAPFYSVETGTVTGLMSSVSNGRRRSQAIPIRLIATASQIVRDLARASDVRSSKPQSDDEPAGPPTSIAGLAAPTGEADQRCRSEKPVVLDTFRGWTVFCLTDVAPICIVGAHSKENEIGIDIVVDGAPAEESAQVVRVELSLQAVPTEAELRIDDDRFGMMIAEEPGILIPASDADPVALVDSLLTGAAVGGTATAVLQPADQKDARTEHTLPLAGFDLALGAALTGCGYVG